MLTYSMSQVVYDIYYEPTRSRTCTPLNHSRINGPLKLFDKYIENKFTSDLSKLKTCQLVSHSSVLIVCFIVY